MFGLSAIEIAGLLFAATASVSCPAMEPAVLDFVVDAQPVKYVNSLDRNALDTKARAIRRQTRKAAPNLPPGFNYSNLTLYEAVPRFSVELKPQRRIVVEQQLLCQAPGQIIIIASLEPVVYVASEVPDGSCLQGAFAEHSLKQHEIAMGAMGWLERQLPGLVAHAFRDVEKPSPITFAEAETNRQRYEAVVRREIRDISGKLQEVRNAADARLETFEALVGVLQECPEQTGLDAGDSRSN